MLRPGSGVGRRLPDVVRNFAAADVGAAMLAQAIQQRRGERSFPGRRCLVRAAQHLGMDASGLRQVSFLPRGDCQVFARYARHISSIREDICPPPEQHMSALFSIAPAPCKRYMTTPLEV